MFMTQNFVLYFLDCIVKSTESNSQYNFFDTIFVTVRCRDIKHHSLYSILDFDWLIHLQITACKYRSVANNWCKYFIEHAHFENASSASNLQFNE